MELYRRCNVFEHLLCMADSPAVLEITQKVVDVLFRCTYINGSTTLVTRYGLLSWLGFRLIEHKGKLKDRLTLLSRRLQQTCDDERVKVWSDGSIAATFERIDVRN